MHPAEWLHQLGKGQDKGVGVQKRRPLIKPIYERPQVTPGRGMVDLTVVRRGGKATEIDRRISQSTTVEMVDRRRGVKERHYQDGREYSRFRWKNPDIRESGMTKRQNLELHRKICFNKTLKSTQTRQIYYEHGLVIVLAGYRSRARVGPEVKSRDRQRRITMPLQKSAVGCRVDDSHDRVMMRLKAKAQDTGHRVYMKMLEFKALQDFGS